MSERIGFLGIRRVKIHVTYLDPEKEFQICSHTYTLMPHILEEDMEK